MVTKKLNFKRDLFNPKKNITRLLYDLKGEPFEFVYSTLSDSSTHPVVKAWLFANPFPKKFSDLRKEKLLPSSGNLDGEIAWNLFPIICEYKKINSFLELKQQYEYLILKGNYTDARAILQTIEQDLGKSLWLIENKLILAEIEDGTLANWTTMSEFAKELTDGLLLYFTENYSKRIEEKITYARYRDILINQISDLAVGDDFKEYLLYRLNYIGINGFFNYDYFLSTESTSSLVDRYLLLREILIEIIEPSKRNLFRKILSKCKVVDDILLKQLSNYCDIGEYQIFDLSQICISLFDHYTEGNYDLCLQRIPTLIRENPNCIELYDLYAKSNIENGHDFLSPNISPIVDKIIYSLFILYKKDGNTGEAIEELLKIVTVHFSTDWAKQLLSLLSSLSNIYIENKTYHKFYLLCSKINNPKNLRDFENDISNYNLKNLIESFPNSSSLRILKAIDEGDSDVLSDVSNLPEAKKNVYLLKTFFNSKEYRRVISVGEEILQNVVSPYTLEETLILVFKSYMLLKSVQNALLLYVNKFLQNSFFVKRLDSEELAEIVKVNINAISGRIELPIFYSILNKDPYDVYVAYDTFLTALSLERPSQLILQKANFEVDKLIFFMREVCRFEVLKHSFHFINREDIEKERLLLLDDLLKIDKKNEALYIKEITALTQNAAVKKAIREVNRAKITINVEQLKNAEANNIREGFNRYIELVNFSRNRNIHGIDISTKQLNDYYKNLNNELKNKVVYTNDPAFISFKVMLLDIRDKFLFSKEYGLDGYLSTRIRHGTLQNYVRSVFEGENLISQKNANGEYLDIEIWKAKLPYFLANKNRELQEAIHEFSKEIDDYTVYLIKELIQVKTEKNDKKANALFDYSLTQHELAAIFQLTKDSIKDHKAFINVIFGYLTQLTERILGSVKKEFFTTITDKYSSMVNKFQDTTKEIFGQFSFPELNSAIMKCNTLIRKEIANITEWFNISNPTSESWLDLNTLIQTSIQITNRIYPYKKIQPEVTVAPGYEIKGSINLIYIMRILLDNIIQHSGHDTNELEIKIDVSTQNEFLRLNFSNNFSSSVNSGDLNHKLTEVARKWRQTTPAFEKIDVEGGSGFEKIRRILTFDMRNKEHWLEFSIKDNWVNIIICLKLTVDE